MKVKTFPCVVALKQQSRFVWLSRETPLPTLAVRRTPTPLSHSKSWLRVIISGRPRPRNKAVGNPLSKLFGSFAGFGASAFCSRLWFTIKGIGGEGETAYPSGRPFPIMLVKLAFYVPGNSRFTSKEMLKLCSIKKMLLWFQKMLRFTSSKTYKTRSGIMCAYYQLNKVKSGSLLIYKTSDTAKTLELSLEGLVYVLRQNFLLCAHNAFEF